ncbi:DEAD/DEAH box helicase (plasmid) [Clostridium perfringens]
MEYIARYKDMGKAVPQEKRKEINEKILYMIDNDLVEKNRFNKEIIFNLYTGNGGLHGLNFKDFGSFHEFTKAKQEKELGAFFTQQRESKKLIELLQIKNDELVSDIACGSGSLFNYLPNLNNVYCNELDIKNYKVCKYLFPGITINNGDMRDYKLTNKLDVILGNPPFNLRLNYNGVEKKSQMIYIEKANELMNTAALMGIIVPCSFLNDEFSDKSDIEYMNKHFNFIGQFELDKRAFDNVGVDSNFKIKMMFFVKKSQYLEEKKYINKFTTEGKIKEDIEKIRQIKEKNKASIKLENMKNYSDADAEFEKKTTKILFDIKRSKHVKHLYNECFNYYQLYYNQKQPSTLSNEEWNKIKITKEKVIKKLKDTLSSQHKKKTIKSENPEKTMRRKLREKNRQDIPFEEMEIDEDIDKWLSESQIYDYYKNEKIYLNKNQKEIVNKMLQKDRGYISAGMGSGKTLMGIHVALYREKNNNTKNTLCIAPSLAIHNTWKIVLESYKIPFKIINRLEDIKNIEKNEFILITFNMLCKYQKHLKKYLQKKINNNYQLVLDEADGICNINSSRTKATLNVCKKAKYKLLMSGTATRNDISEIYTSLKLMYGESLNFICNCRVIQKEDDKTKDLIERYNEYYNKPFPAYKKGYDLFRACFNPSKTTVFGVKDKTTQDVYNVDNLKELLNKSMICRSFEDIIGKKLYTIKQHIVKFNDSERRLYSKAIKEFYSMKYLFNSTGNTKKDRYLEIIQQLNLLLDVCSQPTTYKEYDSKDLPNKYKKVLELLNNYNNENVAIGCRTLKEINVYRNLIEEKINNRNLYIITGTTSMKNRKKIIEQLEKDSTGILLSTQQSLSCSMNIPFINKIIITRLPWNFYVEQYFFRFIRYNSKRKKEVHIISYENSLENNLMALIIAKQKLNNIIRNQEEIDIEEELGIDFNLVDMLLSKERDEMGCIRINWGEQKIS